MELFARVLPWLALFLYLIVFPALICLLAEKRPALFRFPTVQTVLAAAAVFSWLFTNALWWVPCSLGLIQIRGPEAAFALIFGWLYVGIAGTPFFLIYGILRFVRRSCRKS